MHHLCDMITCHYKLKKKDQRVAIQGWIICRFHSENRWLLHRISPSFSTLIGCFNFCTNSKKDKSMPFQLQVQIYCFRSRVSQFSARDFLSLLRMPTKICVSDSVNFPKAGLINTLNYCIIFNLHFFGLVFVLYSTIICTQF